VCVCVCSVCVFVCVCVCLCDLSQEGLGMQSHLQILKNTRYSGFM